MEREIYNSYVEVDMAALRHNYSVVKAHIGDGVGLIPVLKSNAYGHGTVPMARFFALEQGVDLIAVSQLIEGVEIRRAGVGRTDILVMGGLLKRQLPAAVSYDIQFALFDADMAAALSAEVRTQGRTARAQLKIETGMGRIGVKPGPDLEALLDVIDRLGNIEIAGLFTHYATAETADEPFAHTQFAVFRQAVAQLEARGLRPRYVHSCNTGASTWFREAFGTHIRAGCMALGYPSMNDFTNPLGLMEPLSWRAFVTCVHDLAPGESCGYEHHYTADRPVRLAVINVGYGDGMYRLLAAAGGPVIVNNTRTRFLAACMDMSMVDVTGIDCRVGDEVTLIGRSRGGAVLSVNELTQLTGQPCTVPLVTLNHRVDRVYINE